VKKEVIFLMNRKGSLSLSINAIVVLILAITMLGLGLAFINGMFGGTTNKLKGMMGNLDQGVKDSLMSSVDRITLSSTSIEVTKGKKETLYFAVRNDLEAGTKKGTFTLKNTAANPVVNYIFCDKAVDNNAVPATGEINTIDFSTYASIDVNPGESKVLPLEIKPKSSAVSTVYGCHVELCNPAVPPDATSQPPTSSNGYKCLNSDLYKSVDFEVIVK
jgi:hypothetical protein